MADIGQGLNSVISTATNVVGSVSAVADTLGNLSATRLGLADLTDFAGGVGDVLGAVAAFSDMGNANDWRVRLSLPTIPSFRSSPVLKPLKEAGGLVFPYTPEISIQSTAKYNSVATTHTNYAFNAYENSNPGTITITAPMNVEDPTQAIYWIAALHYCRSLTKMFSGPDTKAGNPPPIVFLNGYGNYVFKNIPVAVTNFQTTLSKDCDYIGCDVQGSMMGAIADTTDSLGGLADVLGGAIPGLSGVTDTISSIAGGVGAIAGLAGSVGLGGSTSAGRAHVPTKSTFTITLQPMYSRTNIRKFSLERFAQGGYMSNNFGYI